MNCPQRSKICPEHQDYLVPMIFTFAFPKYEYWCPYCNYMTGIFGVGDVVDRTPELEAIEYTYRKLATEYLEAVGILNCDSTEYPKGSGIYIKPTELPQEIINKYMEIKVTGWKTGIRLESNKYDR